MKISRLLDRRAGFSIASFLLLAAMIAPSILPVFASAATLTARSVAMSSSATSAAGAQYTVSFGTSATTSAVIIDWCSDSPIIGVACTAPTGFNAGSATVAFTSAGYKLAGTVSTTGTTAAHTVISGTTAASGAGTMTFTLTTITNPSTLGSFYARIYTYPSTTTGYTSATNYGTATDTGGVAMATTNAIGVSAAVKEALTFCVTAASPTAACANAASSVPGIVLGHGTPLALDSSATDTAINYAEISTNASGGAIVYMTNSNTTCGGLRRVSAGATLCDIAPQTTAASAPSILGTAKFGMNVGAQDNSLSGATGTIAASAPYSTASQYGMNWVSGNATGVGSTYGDPIFNTSGAPISNVFVPLTFAASVSNATPAGLYSATMNLVATGTF